MHFLIKNFLIINFLPSLPDLTHTKILLLCNNRNKTKYFPLQNPFLEDPVLQIRDSQQSITANLWPLTAHIYYVMIIVTSGFSKKSFITFRSSRTQTFFKTCAVRNVAIFTGKHLCFGVSF